MASILVTGSAGFVGRQLCKELEARGHDVIGAVRAIPQFRSGTATGNYVEVGDIGAQTDWSRALVDCGCVIHLAGRAHILGPDTDDAMTAFRQTNVDGTLQLARQALAAGVKRFIFISSIGVHGQENDKPFSETDTPTPVDYYAVSKLEAEVALSQLLQGTEMQLVIIRPPLIYGPGCPGNFARLLKLVALGYPLPLKGIQSKRSFVSIWNFCSFIISCTEHQGALGGIMLVSDMDDVSLSQVLQLLGEGMNRPVRLFNINPSLLVRMAALVGKDGQFRKLCGSLTVDATPAALRLNWRPVLSTRDGLLRTGKWYAENR